MARLGLVPRNLPLTIGTFYALSVIVYLASLVFVPGTATYFVPQVVSVLLLVPLFIWYRSRRAASPLGDEKPQSRRLVVLAIGGLFLLVMSVRLPVVAFLAFPLEKSPLIYLVVLTALLVEGRPVSTYGFTLERARKQLSLGIFLLFGALILPVAAIVTALVSFYGVNLLAGYDFVPVFFSLPFQVLAVGISEEGFFRGYMQTKLGQVTGIKRAIVFQSALFGVWHFVWHVNPLDLMGMALHVSSTLVFGLLTGAYFRYSGAITGLALFHGLSNSLGEGLNPNLSSLPFSADIALAIFALVELISAALLIILADRVSRALRIWPRAL